MTKSQKLGGGLRNILFEPKYSSLPSNEEIPFLLSVAKDFNIKSIPFFSWKYFISCIFSSRSLYLFTIFVNS